MVRRARRDGRWRVDRSQLQLTGRGRDGVWLRVTQYGYHGRRRATGTESAAAGSKSRI